LALSVTEERARRSTPTWRWLFMGQALKIAKKIPPKTKNLAFPGFLVIMNYTKFCSFCLLIVICSSGYSSQFFFGNHQILALGRVNQHVPSS
jgi:hypothetical protein